MEDETLRQLEQIIGYQFCDRAYLLKAFTHSSAVDIRSSSNERLEFLGDSILSLVICQTLFERSPDYLEGDLTKMKSMLVSRRTCAKIARDMGLHEFLRIGKGMAGNQALSRSLAAGLLEAVIAAIYLDGGMEAAREFVLRSFDSVIDEADVEQAQGNFKSMLQQYAQQSLTTTPIYVLLDEKGPDHNKCFEVQAVVNSEHFPSAWGTNKKEAEQKAAFNALVTLGVLRADLLEQAVE
jgi:ribonuclease-3